tara:strand:- start:845 stop:1447 length:603 start_codon:yes stop_codon:yes gene_type:complete
MFSGVGIGLAIADKLLREIGGSLGYCEKLDGKPGTRLWFSVPFLPAENNDNLEYISTKEKAPEVRQKALLVKRVRKKLSRHSGHLESSVQKHLLFLSVLIVEDNPVNEKMLRAMLRTLLGKKGPRSPVISNCTNGRQALEYLQTNETPDVVSLHSHRLYISRKDFKFTNSCFRFSWTLICLSWMASLQQKKSGNYRKTGR